VWVRVCVVFVIFGVVVICVFVFTVFFILFRICVFILICFVCTSVRPAATE
jgi:hypothetical protein